LNEEAEPQTDYPDYLDAVIASLEANSGIKDKMDEVATQIFLYGSATACISEGDLYEIITGHRSKVLDDEQS
jgi:hypothetical protein